MATVALPSSRSSSSLLTCQYGITHTHVIAVNWCNNFVGVREGRRQRGVWERGGCVCGTTICISLCRSLSEREKTINTTHSEQALDGNLLSRILMLSQCHFYQEIPVRHWCCEGLVEEAVILPSSGDMRLYWCLGHIVQQPRPWGCKIPVTSPKLQGFSGILVGRSPESWGE